MVNFKREEVEKIWRATSDTPNFETSSGFTGNKKGKYERFTVGQKRRKIDHLTRKDRETLHALHAEVDKMFVANSKISRKEEGKKTKRDYKRGKTLSDGVDGIHSSATFEKYKKTSKQFVKYCLENYGIDKLSDIKPGMFITWTEERVKNGKGNGEKYSAKTIAHGVSAIKKFAECAAVVGNDAIERLDSKKVVKKVKKLRDDHGVKYSREEYKRGKNTKGKLGYSLKEAQRITKQAYDISPYYGVMFEVLTYTGLRHEELLKTKWRHIDTENKRIYLDDPNHTKGSRPRWVPIPEKLANKIDDLKVVMDAKNDDTRIWGVRLNQDNVRDLMKHCCTEAHVGYGAVHDFRRSAVEYHTREINKAIEKENLDKEAIANLILEHVNADPDKLNPMEAKQEPKRDENGRIVYEIARDKDGNVRYYPNGTPRKQIVWQLKRDIHGNIIEDRRYTKEELVNRKTVYLVNALVAQILGHNRTDSTSPYKNG